MEIYAKWKQKLAGTDPAAFYLLTAMLTVIAALWGFIELADEVMEGETQQIDALILSFFRTEADATIPIGPEWVLQVARDITALGGHTVLILFTLIAAGYCATVRCFDVIYLILTASIGGIVLNALLKWSFARPRPDIVPHLVEVSTASFPSGHAMLSAVIYLSLGAIIAQVTQGHKRRLYIIATAMVMTGLIGFSRIYLGVHYPSDVLAGWAVGLIWAILCWLGSYMLTQHKTKG